MKLFRHDGFLFACYWLIVFTAVSSFVESAFNVSGLAALSVGSVMMTALLGLPYLYWQSCVRIEQQRLNHEKNMIDLANRLSQVTQDAKDEIDKLSIEVQSLADLLSGKEKQTRDSIPSSLRRRVMNRSKCRCEYCGRKGEDGKDPDGQSWHIDHVVPVTRGGPTRTDNLVLACNRCNISKGNRPVHLFVRRLARRMANGEIKL